MTTIATVFSGGEGVGVGARAAGMQHIWGVEYKAEIAKVAEVNGFSSIVADFLTVDPRTLAAPDVFHASPVCKNASVANAKRGETPWDIACGEHVAHFIDVLRPAVVTIENVYQYRDFEAFKRICGALNRGGYMWDYDNINAADYSVPQTRRRLILRATRVGMLPNLPPPERWVGWYEAIEDLIPTLPESKFAPWQLSRMAIPLLRLVRQSETWYNPFQEIANYDERTASEVLWVLQARVDSEVLQQWVLGIMEGFQASEILQPDVHGASVREGASGGYSEQEQHARIFAQVCERWGVRIVRSAGGNGCSPQGLGLDEQLPRQLAAYLSQLSHEDSQPAKDLFSRWMRGNSHSARLLQQTLSSFQEIWQSIVLESENSSAPEEANDYSGCIGSPRQNEDMGCFIKPVVQESTGGTQRKLAFIINTREMHDHREENPVTVRHGDEPLYTVSAGGAASRSKAFIMPGGNSSNLDPARLSDEPLGTLTADRKNNGTIRAWLSTGRVVSMTPRALARFQSFPDSYILPDSKKLACTVIGNSVCPLLYEKIIAPLVASY